MSIEKIGLLLAADLSSLCGKLLRNGAREEAKTHDVDAR